MIRVILKLHTYTQKARRYQSLTVHVKTFSVSDVYPNIFVSQAGTTYRLHATAAPVSFNTTTMVLKRELSGNEGCFNFTSSVVRPGTSQIRNKFMCFACDGEDWIDITNDIVDCEMGFFRRYESNNSGFVSYQNHWDMSNSTHSYSNNGWPDTNFQPDWGPAEGSPFMATDGWDLTYDLCVTCCEIQPPDDPANPWLNNKVLGAVAGNTGSNASNVSRPFNNKSCLPDQIQDPNLGGHTGSINDGDRSIETFIEPCSDSLPSSVTIGDTFGAANGMYWEIRQHGFAQITQAEIDNIDGGQPACNNSLDDGDCTRPARDDYSYLLTINMISLACSSGGLYKIDISPSWGGFIPMNWDIENRQTNASCSVNLGNSYTAMQDAYTYYVGIWETPQGETGSPYWQISGTWDSDDDGSDNRPVLESRYSGTTVVEPYIEGLGSNPLP